MRAFSMMSCIGSYSMYRDRSRSLARPEVGSIEENRVEKPLQHRVQAAGADVLGLAVDLAGDPGDLADRVGLELEAHPLGREQRLVLLHERVARLLEDPDELCLPEVLELDADREAPLELGDQVGRTRDVERPRGDEQNVVRAHHAVLGLDARALDERQQVALHALARDVGSVGLASGDLVDLVDEHDRGRLDQPDRLLPRRLGVDEPLRLLVAQELPRAGHRHAAAPAAARRQAAHKVLQVEPELLDALRREDLEDRHRALGRLDVDLAGVELAGAKLLPQSLSRRAGSGGLPFGPGGPRI
jgi:hypothetical protein